MAMYHKSVSEINTLVIQYPAWKKKKEENVYVVKERWKAAAGNLVLLYYLHWTVYYLHWTMYIGVVVLVMLLLYA